MPLLVNIEEGESYVDGRTQENARRLLAAAAALDLDPWVVRTTQSGFIVPTEVEEYDPDAVEDVVADDADADDEAPSKKWTHERLDAYAEAHDVQFKAGLNKTDKVATLTAAQAEKE